ncbi:acyltransferase family protein [Flavobacteriales bacterium]|nr:acyltransferase family protein [Flavobacteriales bacterium]
MNKIKTLDGLRGYAALFVLFAHYPFKEKLLPDFVLLFLNKFQLGYFGVELFFVLSGFLITRILIKEKKSREF